jgi:hypothetical protein
MRLMRSAPIVSRALPTTRFGDVERGVGNEVTAVRIFGELLRLRAAGKARFVYASRISLTALPSSTPVYVKFGI